MISQHDYQVICDELQDAEERIAELEQNQTTNNAEIEQNQAIRDLEQQAKGIEDAQEYIANTYDWDWGNCSSADFSQLLPLYVEKLHQKAKELSNGK